jgi:hypothetical protein
MGDAAPLPPASVPPVVLGVPQFAKVEGDATRVNLAWWAVKGAAQYEVLRAADPRGTASVRSTLPAGTLGYRDTLPAMPPAYFALVAIGADGARSAGAWTLVNTPTIQGIDPGPRGVVTKWTTVQPAPAGFEIWRTADPQQPGTRVGIAKNWQLTGGQAVELSSGTGISLQVKNAHYILGASEGNAYLPGNWTDTVDRDRAANIGRNDTLKIGMGAVTSVGTDWNLTAAQAIALKAGKQLSLNSGQASVQFNADSSVSISGTKLSVNATGDLQLVSGGTVTINGTKWMAGSAGAAQGFGTNDHPASSGTGASCTLGDVSLTAAVIGNGTPADGRTVPIVGNQALFSLLGTNFGGDGKSTFALPDLRAVAPNGLTYMICTQGVFPQK